MKEGSEPPITAEPAALEEPKGAPAGEIIPASYAVGTWAGQPLYRCLHCAFDTLGIRDIERHVRLAHGREPVKE